MRTFLRRFCSFVVIVGGLGSQGAGCSLVGAPEIDLAVSLPNALIESTVWFEVGAFKDASCAAILPMLPNGVPEGETARVAFKRTDPRPRLGDIPNGRYAFAAVARDDNCAILASGCTEKDVGDVSLVSIGMKGTEEPTGQCPKGASCQAAKCVPAIDNSDPSVGAGCSLELLGAGPLANPIGGAGSLVSAPVIVATSTGSFIIGYREIDPNGAGARITILPIDPAGGALTPLRPALPNPCSNADETDGVGLVMNGDNAMMALAKAPCSGKAPELQLLNFTATPELGKFIVSTKESSVRVSLGAARSAATRPGGSLVVYSNGDVATVANMIPDRGIVEPIGTFGGRGGGITDAWIAANDKVLALLAVGGGSPVSDAGGDGGSTTQPDETTSTLRLQLLAADTDISKLVANDAAPITFPGEWGSIAASQGRVIVLSDGTGPGRSVTYRAFDLNRDTPADMSGFSVEGSGKVTAGDVALVGNRAYFAALKPGAVALHVFGNATTTLTPLASVLFSRETRISAINTVRDGRVSVAATPARVAVAWTTTKVLSANDATGGYAVFGCTE
jgi:hypothetical protein